MSTKFKTTGLWVAVTMQALFWVLYISMVLYRIGSPSADIYWLLSGALGIFFGVINFKKAPRNYIRLCSVGALLMGVFLLVLWGLAMFVAGM